jgi:dTDP-4-dehydrorhamnose 3,5-epimerase
MIQTEIMGVLITPLREIADVRGSVLHMLRSDAVDFTNFGECYFSEVLPGAVKAWKKHTIQTQNIAVPIGRILLVIFDSRKTSNTENSLMKIELGRPDAYQRVQIPPGVWYGFTCISPTPALLVNCADHPHTQSESEIKETNSTDIPFFWNKAS